MSRIRNSKIAGNWKSRVTLAEPEPIQLSLDNLVTIQEDPDRALPLVIDAAANDVQLDDWAASNRELIDRELLDKGAILFRGFDVNELGDFERVVAALKLEMMQYMESSTPRRRLGENVYTSTEFPSEETIALHSELSAAATFPKTVLFCCLDPADVGGETPLADARRVLAQIDADILAEFEEKQWLLVRNYNEGIGLRWQDAFHTESRADVETYCRDNLMDFRWHDSDKLITYQVRPAVARHYANNVPVWFNHIAFWHVANLPPNVYQALSAEFGEDGLPYQVYYGDGSRIDDSVAHALRDAYLKEKVKLPWRKGDVLILDNMLTAHGREPFQGSRTIAAALCDPYSRTDLAMECKR